MYPYSASNSVFLWRRGPRRDDRLRSRRGPESDRALLGPAHPRGGQSKEASVIREARTTDISDIRAMMNSVAGFWDASWRPDVLERALGSPDTIALVHQDGAVIDGFTSAHDLGFRAYLSELVVAPQTQRRGIGARLLAEIERRVAERGCAVIVADVWQDAEEFYRSQGWTPPSVILVRKRLPSACANRQTCPT